MDPRQAAELIQAAGAAVAAARLLQLGLSKQYPAILRYLLFLSAINLVFGLENYVSCAYFYSYVFLEPLKCILSVIAVRELFAVIFRNYPGIRTVGRWAIYGGTILALSISFAATLGSRGGPGRSKIFYFEMGQRTIVFSLAVVTGMILLSLSRYPLRLRGNTTISSIFFGALFLSDAGRLLIDSFALYLHNHYVDETESVFTAMCLVAWAALLKSEDESEPARVVFSTPREEHLLQQLTALNRMMARAARR